MAMLKNLAVSASCLLQGIGKDRQQIEAAVVVNGLGEFRDSAVALGEPGKIGGDRAEGVAEDVAEEAHLHLLFVLANPFGWGGQTIDNSSVILLKRICPVVHRVKHRALNARADVSSGSTMISAGHQSIHGLVTAETTIGARYPIRRDRRMATDEGQPAARSANCAKLFAQRLGSPMCITEPLRAGLAIRIRFGDPYNLRNPIVVNKRLNTIDACHPKESQLAPGLCTA
jgi:hypothetical protein